MNSQRFWLLIIVYTLPLIVFAQNLTAEILVGRFNRLILNPLIILLFGIALLVFSWGVLEFIRNVEADEGREKGKRHMLYGIIGMFVMVSVFGLLRFVLDIFGVTIPDGLK